MTAGLDVAGPGESETVLCVRQGPRIVLLRGWASEDARGHVLDALLPFKSRLKRVQVDTVGIGYYMAKHLNDHGFPVTQVNVGEAPRDRERFSNRKAEIYWQFRERASAGDLAGLTDDRAIAQLTGIRYSHNNHGQVVIESKEDARKRGVKSPDRAEAIILAFAELGGSLGILEFYRREVEASRALDGGGADRGAASVRERPSCPRCHSPASKILAAWRCVQCGFQFGESARSLARPSRRDMGDFLG